MHIIPQIQIANNQVVTLQPNAAVDVLDDIAPIQAVQKIAAQGAEQIQIIDVDAARLRKRNNAALLRQLINVSAVPVQIAGGIRTITAIAEWLEQGADSVVLGTVAIQDPTLVSEAANRYPGAIFVNIATKGGLVMIDGWCTQTAFRPQDIVYDLQLSEVAGIIHTDIDRFYDRSVSLALTMEISKDLVIPVYSSGTVHDLEDISTLQFLPNLHGALISRPLFDGSFELKDALALIAKNKIERQQKPDASESAPSAMQSIQRGIKLYLSGYNLLPVVRWWNRQLRQAITQDNHYVEVLIPQEDLDAAAPHSDSRADVQRLAYQQAMDAADALLVLLDGIENEAWTGFECGYARANGKYLIGVMSKQPNPLNERFAMLCDEVVIHESSDDLQATLETIAREVNSRLLQHQIG